MDRVVGTFVLSPGDIHETRFAHELVDTGCWSLNGGNPCMAYTGCGTLVASRTDDCGMPQDTRFYPDMVAKQTCAIDSETLHTHSHWSRLG